MTTQTNTPNGFQPIPTGTRVVIKKTMYAGTEATIVGKFDARHGTGGNLYSLRATRLVFWGKPFDHPHGTHLNLYPSDFAVQQA